MMDIDKSETQGVIHRKAILVILLALVVTVVISSWLALSRIKAETREDLSSTLQTVLASSHEAISYWAQDSILDATHYASRPDVLEAVKQQLRIPQDKESLLASNSLATLRRIMDPILERHDYLGFFVIAPNKVNIASMRDQNLGAPNLLASRDNYLEDILGGKPCLVLPLASDVPLPTAEGRLSMRMPTMFIAVPVFDEKNNVIAALAIRVNPADNFSRITQLGRTGATGETYAFNDKGQMITESRFLNHLQKIGLLGKDDSAILNISLRDPGGNMLSGFRPVSKEGLPLTLMAQNAIDNSRGINIDGYRDYRGVPVIGAWLWDDTFGFGLTFEIDVDEAYRSYQSTRATVIVTLSVTVIMFISLAIGMMFSQKTITDTNVKLHQENKERRIAEQALRESESKFRTLFQYATVGVALIDIDGHPVMANNALQEMLGYSEEELAQMSFHEFTHPVDVAPSAALFNELLAGKRDHFKMEKRYITKSGGQIWGSLGVSILHHSGDSEPTIIATIEDITERKKSEQTLIKLSTTDKLSSLANRRMFDEFLENEWRRSARAQTIFSIIMLDIDYFKPFNDFYGHPAGDECIRQIGTTIKAIVKRPGDLAARYGGEEFSIILPSTDQAGAMVIANAVKDSITALAIPHEKSEISDRVTASIGVASTIANADANPQALLKEADQALYTAKKEGRNRIIDSSINGAFKGTV
ncbi:diguanylate cyclase domain-containing protein [Pseudomonadota bacterium]